MTALHHLESYLASLDRRLRLFAASRGLAASAFCAVGLTILLTWIANQYRFAAGVVWPLRIVLFGGVACALVFALARPWLRINRWRTARLAESRVSDFGERLITITERHASHDAFSELIAEDALRVAELNPPAQFAPATWLIGFGVVAAVCAIALTWLVTAAPGYWGYGASLLWTSVPRSVAPLYDISVTPGDKTVRRRTDQIIAAQLKGFSASTVVLHAKYHDALKWNEIPMQTQPSGNGYQLLFPGLADSLEYFVQAGASQSKHFTLAVKDLPTVKHLRVALHFPKNIGLQDSVEDPGGDIRAVQGSKADIGILTDKPLQNGVLVMENGSRIPLSAGKDNWLTATLPVDADGSYHVAALDGGEAIRMTDNYIIESRKDEAPTVSIVRPGRDAGVSPIEELPVTVTSSDDFGLRSLDLHYSVNGGPEQVKPLAKKSDAKQAEGKTLLPLEEFKVAPGDLLTFYATAKDATHTSRSDIVFAKVEPFDLKFQQSQQSGGGGGGGGQQDSQISARQKEIIAATWNQLKDPAKDAGALTQNARFLADLEAKLGDQAKALAERMSNRELGETSPQFAEFSKSMILASTQMADAVKQLQPAKWTGALAPEQKALQSILHAESLFRNIQVAFGKQSGGGGGGGGQERDLARLFDLELDTAKNQYESGQSAAASQEEADKQLDQQLERLKELARRQQQLASEQKSPQQQFQQKWEEEQLRREAEQLRQQLAQQMQQNGQQQPGSQSSSAQSSSSQQQPGQRSSARNAEQKNAMRQTMDALSKAEEEMRNAASHPDDSYSKLKAANQLASAQQSMRDMQRQRANNGLSELAEKARQLSTNQSDLGQRVKKLYGAEGVNTARSAEDGSPLMPEMNGPGYAGGWSRRRFQPTPDRPATSEEKSLAAESDNLAAQMQELQQKLHEQAASLAGQQPESTRKLRKALSEAEQAEIAMRMRKSAEWMKQGFGPKTWPVEDSITAATKRLSQQVEEARQAGENPQNGTEPEGEGALGQALSEVRALREQLQSQSQQKGSQGNPRSSSQSGGNQLAGLRSQLGRVAQQGEFPKNDKQLNGYVNDAMASLRQMDGQTGLLDARLNNNALASLERLEVELAKRIGQKAGARNSPAENVPDSYREAVATYFRILSK